MVDLPPEEAGGFLAVCEREGMAYVPLIAPTTTEARMKVLAEEFPVDVRAGLGRFARSAVEAKDGRWRRHAAEAPLEARSRLTKEPESPDLTAPPALMLRLRAGFGVTAKSDVLAVLLGLDERRTPIQALPTATGYAGVTLREATHDLALARFIRVGAEPPLSYYAPRAPWTALLRREGGANAAGGEALPAWRFWSQVFAFLAHVDDFARSKGGREGSVYVQGSLARDHIEVHRRAFTLNRIELPEVEVYREETYLSSFHEAVQRLVAWMAEQV